MEPMTTEALPYVPVLLVVDDTPAHLQLLSAMLLQRGYRVRTAAGGQLALQAVQQEKPDLILLDINMPDLNGYEVCERLKADAALREIPVLFISALGETRDKLKAFAAGGVDYVTKPFQFKEVAARVETHLRLRRLQLELEHRNRQLQENLDQLRKLETLRDNLTHMMVHDMRSPLVGITGNLEYLTPHCAALPAEDRDSLRDATSSARRLIDMVSSLLDVSRLEAGKMPINHVLCDLRRLAQETVQRLSGFLQQHPVTIAASPAQVQVRGDNALIQRVLVNLLGNAAKFSPVDSPIQISFQAQPDSLKVMVCDSGPGIPSEYHVKIFEKFGQVEALRQNQLSSSGLGLTFCKLAVEAHGGGIGVESAPGHGSIFWFTLPRLPTEVITPAAPARTDPSL